MVTKSQRKAAKAKRKAKKIQRRKQVNGTSATKRLAIRMAKQTPDAWADELSEDRAVFDDQALDSLSAQDQQYALKVREALSLICDGADDEALEPLGVIGRRSVFADWRLLLRGLVEWFEQDLPAATETWSRLDSVRRPARIAMSMILAHREDLLELEQRSSNIQADPLWPCEVDRDLIYHAKLVRKHQIDRIAIRDAASILRIPKGAEDALVSPEHIAWLRDFTTEHRLLEPDLVQSLHEVTLLRAYCGPYIDVFRDAATRLRGPRHDRKNNLLRSMYERASRGQRDAQVYLNQYIDVDLPENTELSPKIKGALASMIHLSTANAKVDSPAAKMGGFFFQSRDVDMDHIMSHFQSAVDSYPQHRAAWQAYTGYLHDYLDDDNTLKKSEREETWSDLATIYRQWIRALPDDLEPRMVLVDYLLDHDLSDEAKEHVDWLSGTRRDNPLANAIHWKWSILEAMRLCRRKTQSPQSLECLDETAKTWPKWLSDDWLRYLRAAAQLRGGDDSAINALSFDGDRISAVTDACMKLGAAQRMRVPAAQLKPFRQAVDGFLENIEQLSVNDLLSLGSFYWDLQRTNLRYPALRMHGTKFLARMENLLDEDPPIDDEQLGNPMLLASLLAMSSEGMFNDRYEAMLPYWFDDLVADKHPLVAAVTVQSWLRCRVNWELNSQTHWATPLRAHAANADAFYRHFYNQLADDLESKASEKFDPQASIFGDLGAMFERAFRQITGEECDCDDCRAARGEL